MKLDEFAQRFTIADLRAAANTSIDTILEIIRDADDAQVVFLPHDPQANDPYAVAGEEHIGWSLAHLVVHVTASAEEWATYSAILARGLAYPAEPRLRYETNWHTVTTKAQCVQRLEESRRMRLAYLDAWPDTPHLDVYREMSERFTERFGQFNAISAFVFGLRHEIGHYAQMREAARLAREAAQV
ncbi:MAG: DinB family protein [Chloroflexi bacterium]|nr:DinB family protein [Chloroflexota bacterium]